MPNFKHLKYFTLFGISTAIASVVGVATFYNTSISEKSLNIQSITNKNHLVPQATGTANQTLGKIRHFKNNNFTGIPIKNTIDGSLVLTGESSITRTDFYGNVLWTFDPNISSDIIAAKSDSQGNLISNGDGTPVLSGKNYVNDLAGKMVIEATQDKNNPNLFYLLLIPKSYDTSTITYDEINNNVKNQGTIVAISENFDLDQQPYGIVGIQNIKASDMVQNYPNSWTSSSATGPTFFSKTNHPNYFGTSIADTSISMPWKIYITNLSNIYGSGGIIYIAGGNGTIFPNDEDVLSIGMFRVKFDFSTQTSSSTGWPYALVLSNIGVVFEQSSANSKTITSLTNLSMGQDANYQYVPRMAVAGLVPTNSSKNNTLNLIGTISIGVKNDEGKPSALTPVADSNIGSNIVTTSDVTATTGNSYTVQTLFETYLNLQSLNLLSDQINFPSLSPGSLKANDFEFSTVLSNSSNISVGVPFEVWNNSTTTGMNYFESYLYALVGVGNFSPRDVGNVVSFENSDDNSYRSYYFQLGGFLLKMYFPSLDQFKFTSSRLSIFKDTKDPKAFAVTTSDTGTNTWGNFIGTFMIGGDNNLQSDQTIIGSVWTTGIYYNKYQGVNSTAQISSTSPTSSLYVTNNLTPPTSITDSAYLNPSSTAPTNGILGYKIDYLKSATVDQNSIFTGVVSSIGTNQSYVQTDGTNSYSPLVYSQRTNSLTIGSVYNQNSKIVNLGSGQFKDATKIDQGFFTNSINAILTTSGNTTILDPRYRSAIFDYSPGQDITSEDWRIVALNPPNIQDNTLTLSAEVKNPATDQYVPIPNLSNKSDILNSATFSGFNALPAYVIPLSVALPIVIVALIVGLSLGIGIPMNKNKKALKQGFDISNKKVDTLTTAVGSVFKQIINRTQIGNIKKSPQMLKSAAPKPTVSTIKPSKPASPAVKKPTAPKSPTPNSTVVKPPVAPAVAKSLAPKKNEDAKK